MNREEVKALKVIANQNITKVFDALNIDYTERYQDIIAPCPIHGGSRRDAFSWHMEYGLYQCFSRGCHGTYGKDIYGLVRGVLGCTFPEAISFVKKIYVGDGKINTKESLLLNENKNFVRRMKRVKEKIIYPEELLEKLTYHNLLEARGYTRDIIELYQAGISDSKYKRMSNRIIFPIRDIDGNIVGFTGRTIFEDWKERGIGKWEHSANFDKEHNLFNIDKAAPHIEKSGQVIITEGPLDVLRLEQAGIKNSVGIFGRKLHPGQISILISLNVSTIIVALDSDDAGKTGAEDAMKTAGAFFQIKIIDLPQGDVGNLSIEEARKIFNEEKEIVGR